MCFTCAIYTDLPFLITNEIPRMWLNYFKIEYPGRLQKWFSNCKLLMWWQNFPKLWCRYESFIIAYEIPRLNLNRFIRKNQEGYRNRLSKTALEFENCKKQLFTLTMCVPARLWGQIARTPSNCTITVRTLLAKCYDYQFQRLILQFPAEGKKISYRKQVHHNASRCWAKRKWLYVLWDKPFSEVWTNRVESMKK